MHKLFDYINGNAQVILFSDGTRIINKLNDKPLSLETPLSLDIKLTNKCSNNCTYCYEKSAKNGVSGKLNYALFESLPAHCEYNIGGGNIFNDDLLFTQAKEKINHAGGIVNTTVNLIDYLKNAVELYSLQDSGFVHGVGVSYNRMYAKNESFIPTINKFWTDKNIMHVINGIVNERDLRLIKDAGIDKILVLGIKNFGNGKTYLSSHKKEILKNASQLLNWLEKLNFNIVSFDNLALTQLSLKDKVETDDWDVLYQGEDGTISFYIDLVEGKFAKNSITPVSKRYNIGDLGIKEMFNIIKNEQN